MEKNTNTPPNSTPVSIKDFYLTNSINARNKVINSNSANFQINFTDTNNDPNFIRISQILCSKYNPDISFSEYIKEYFSENNNDCKIVIRLNVPTAISEPLKENLTTISDLKNSIQYFSNTNTLALLNIKDLNSLLNTKINECNLQKQNTESSKKLQILNNYSSLVNEIIHFIKNLSEGNIIKESDITEQTNSNTDKKYCINLTSYNSLLETKMTNGTCKS